MYVYSFSHNSTYKDTIFFWNLQIYLHIFPQKQHFSSFFIQNRQIIGFRLPALTKMPAIVA